MPKGSTRPTPGRARDKAAAKARKAAQRRDAFGKFQAATPQNTPPVMTAGRLSRGNLGKRVAQPKKRAPGKIDFGSTKRPRKRKS